MAQYDDSEETKIFTAGKGSFKDDAFKYQLLKFLENYRLSESQMTAISEAVEDIVDKAIIDAMDRVSEMVQKGHLQNEALMKKSATSNGRRIGEIEQKMVAFKGSLDSKIKDWAGVVKTELRAMESKMDVQDKVFQTKFGFIEGVLKIILPVILTAIVGALGWLISQK